MGEESKKVSLKLLVDGKANKVLFAEVSKDFVDFLFHILSLPVGTVVKLLSANAKGMVGCLGDLYKSIDALSNDYFQANLDKDSVLKPLTAVAVPLLSLNEAPADRTFYRCSYHNFMTDVEGQRCPVNGCSYVMSSSMGYTYVPPKGPVGMAPSSDGSGGYVKGVVTYMVMDNLEVKPMSTISGITLMNKFNVKDVASLAEKEVHLGLNEGIAMLKASLETRAVLTTVFLGKKKSGP